MVSGLSGDVRLACRRLRRTPGFTITAVLVLALGIGVGTAFFNIVNGAFKAAVEPRVAGAVRLAASTFSPDCSCFLSADDIQILRADPPRSLAWVFGNTPGRGSSVRIAGSSAAANVDAVSGPYFSALGARALAGRLLGPADDDPGQPGAGVISERFWRALGADPAIVGATAYVAGRPVAIVGIVDHSFEGFGSVSPPHLWVTSQVVPVFQLYGRLQDGVTIQTANAEIRARYHASTEREPARTLEVREGFLPPLPIRFTATVVTVLVVNALIVVVAATSLTLMLFARVLAGRGDIGVRLMLGARLWDVARIWMMEVIIIGASASIVGLGIGAWLARAAVQYFMSVSGLAVHLDTSPDWRVAAYVCVLALAVVVGLVLVVGRQLATVNTLASTSAAAGAGGATPRDAVPRGRLITGQMAIATCLLLLAAFFLRRASIDLGDDPGVDASHVTVAHLDQTGTDRHIVQLNNRQALDAALRLPGVTSAALTSAGGGYARTLQSQRLRTISSKGVTPGFFVAAGLHLRRGREVSADDEQQGAPGTVISERTAGALWPGQDALGQELWLDARGGSQQVVRVVGVAPDVRDGPSMSPRELVLYLPYDLNERLYAPRNTTLFLRSSAPAALMAAGVREALGRTAPQVGITAVRTMREELAGEVGPADLAVRALTVFGLLGLTLAVAGLYGLTSYLATQRHREFGIRKALGASNALLLLMVANEGLPSLAKGAGAGAFAAILIAFWLRARQFHSLSPFDPLSLLGVTGVLLLAGFIGTILPFRRLIRREASTMLRER